ncbi:ECF transporter S component [Caproiciproducens galactitolivorans]|uniref:ECF transporter S component n=1 Tax=Caproiciproducens galactitolivorans TaxID=642589 RepID=A0ABT4BWQ0_9FIRM|nr:ECF transporter S component [Caproiciproducens galactitolivorans]MCY1714730.1 ECF transporter S component [Caproiciproducens galactitolivorans]
MNRKTGTNRLVLTALFCAIILLLNFTPIGYIQLPLIKATIIHVPVIIGSILLGPKIGAGLGFVFGLTSLYNNTFAPTLLSFAFSPLIPVPGTAGGSWAALFIAFLPRILVGVVPYYFYVFLNKALKGRYNVLSLALSGLIGSLTNTILVMNLIYFVFRDAYGEVKHIAVDMVYKAVLAVIFSNGVPEAIVAAVLTAVVCRALMKLKPMKA